MPNAYGSPYTPVGVVDVPCSRCSPATRPPDPQRAGAEPTRTHRPHPPRRSHQLTVPLVAPACGPRP